jgi:hypothetical protein
MHIIKLCTVGALCLPLIAAAQAQQPATLTLACKGTLTNYYGPIGTKDTQPISIGIIISFTTQTVQGFGWTSTITTNDDTTIKFSDRMGTLSISGSIDRVTGELEATETQYYGPEHKILMQKAYSLLCKPGQRMF